MRITLLALTLSTLLVSGCTTMSGRVQRGVNLYERTDFASALYQFEVVGEKEPDMNRRSVIRYLVYRGLTHYRVGQRSEAWHFLTRGREAYSRGTASWLSPRTLGEMDRALMELAQNPPPPMAPAPPGPGDTTIILVPNAPPEAPEAPDE
jgi:hypothetical protein